jgi:hypothetical protein
MTRAALSSPNHSPKPLLASGQNELIKRVLEEFCPRFTPGAKVAYLGNAEKKLLAKDRLYLAKLGVVVDEHSKMPDLIVHLPDRNWLVVIEAETSHGPIRPKRRKELKTLLAKSSASLVYVTAIETRSALSQYLAQIAWETEVWVAEDPLHLIHFNGNRFLGPYV